MPKERDILKIIWTNFINSLKPRQFKGTLMGKDHLGNKYFEIPPDPSIGKRKTNRWFEPPSKDHMDAFDAEMPAEWEAWLRYRRQVPPLETEVLKNQAISDMKKQNAAELEILHHPPGTSEPKQEKIQDFPLYKEYELLPGDKDKDNK